MKAENFMGEVYHAVFTDRAIDYHKRMRFLTVCLLAVLPCTAQQNFYPFAVDQDRLSGAPDFSFLNQPITAKDRVVVRNDRFVRAADGSPVRFFGVNFAFGASFPEPQDAVRVAKRLRRLGVNLVRLHHMDTLPDSTPETARSTLTTGPYPTLNPVSVSRLRGFLDALKAEGIYADLNLHVGYTFRCNVDQVPSFPDGAPLPNQSKPLHIFYPRMVDLQLKYAHDLIAALKLKGDPVLAMVEIDNETSLLQAWGSRLLDKAILGEYRAEWLRQWREFRKSGTDAPLEGDEYISFMADRDRNYLRRMRDAIRAVTDSQVPIAGTQMGYGGMLNLETHTDLDYQDNHFYIDHYNFPHTSWDSYDRRIRDTSAVGTGMSSIVNMAVSREAGRPYTVSEFNQPYPNRQAAELDPVLAAFGAFQGWDSIMHFAYSHGRSWDNAAPSSFDINGDWTKWPNVGQSAWLFRSGAISPGKSPLEIPVSREMRMQFTRERKLNAFNAFLAANGVDPALAFVHPIGIRMAEKPLEKQAAPAAPYTSDTGELVYDKAGRTYIIRSAKAAGAVGYFRKAEAGAIDVELVANDHGFATILLTALDNRPLAQSRRMLLSTPGYTLGAGQKLAPYADTQDWWTFPPEPGSSKPSADRSAKSPIMMERVESYITLRTLTKRLTVYPLDGAGRRLAALALKDVVPGGGAFRIHLQADGQALAPWYEIVTE
jgi:hypothetical protein